MKFCKHCGNQIPDNAVCNCPGAIAERQGQGQGYQPQGYQPRVGSGYVSPYAAHGTPNATAQPVGESKFGRGMKNVPQVFASYFRDPKKTVAISKQTGDFVVAIIYTVILFLALIGINSCVYGKNAVALHLGFNFGLVVLAALIETVGLVTAYVMCKFLILAATVKPFNAGKAFADSFISFGVNMVVPLICMIVGGLFWMLTSWVSQIFFAFALFWLVVCLLSEVKDEIPPANNSFVRIIIIAGFLAAYVYLFLLLVKGMNSMNTFSVAADLYSQYAGLFGY